MVNKFSNNQVIQKSIDKHKMWLIAGIAIAVIIVLVLVLYSPVKEALFGEAITYTSPYTLPTYTWTSQDSGTYQNLYGVHFIDANTGWTVGEGGYEGILRTLDGGETWSPQINYGQLYDVHFVEDAACLADVNDCKGWAVGAGGSILNTVDGGENWNYLGIEPPYAFRGVHFIDANTGWAVGPGVVDESILYTDNGGGEWWFQASEHTKNLNGVYFIDINTGWAVGNEGTILRTYEWGTWSSQTSMTYQDLNDVHFIDANTGWVVGAEGTILHTIDGGETWLHQTSGITQELNGVYFVDANTGWAVGYEGIILYTNNGGDTWAAQQDPTGNTLPLYDVHFTDANTGWAVGAGGKVIKCVLVQPVLEPILPTLETVEYVPTLPTQTYIPALEVGLENEICNDSIDNDGNAYVDCADVMSCGPGSSCAKMGALFSAICENEMCKEVICDDFHEEFPISGGAIMTPTDNDGDGLANCDDPDCALDPACGVITTSECTFPPCIKSLETVAFENKQVKLYQILYNDRVRVGVDDVLETVWLDALEPTEINGVLVTVNEIIFSDDDDSTNDYATFTLILAEICTDNLDNDGDGAIDCLDSDCDNDINCAAELLEICDDGIDNDGNNLVDCADPDCLTAFACTCTDSDGGKILDIQGTTTGIDPTNLGQMRTETDRCSTDTRVLEFWCRDDGSNQIVWSGYDCPLGQICQDGACVEPAILGDMDGNSCLSVTEYNDFKYRVKNGLLLDVTLEQYNDLKYEFKNNIGNIMCS